MGPFSVFLLVSFAQQTGQIAVTHWHLGDEGFPVPLATEQALDRLRDDEVMTTVIRSIEASNRAKELESNQSDSKRRNIVTSTKSKVPSRADHADSYGVCSPGEGQNVARDHEKCFATSSVPDGNCLQDDHLTVGKSTDLAIKAISPLSCHLPVVKTRYDHLLGIKKRKNHPMYPEPDVAIIFKPSARSHLDVNMNEVELELLSIISSKSLSETDYNRLGNFWRVRGDTHEAINCYRQGLSRSPDHPDLLLNLARVLVNLEYWDDARELVHKSLQVKSPEHSSWLEQYTLGEISKEKGSLEDAIVYFRQALDLNPNFELAQCQLQELEGQLQNTLDSFSTIVYTLLILVLLTAGVLCLLLWLLGDDEDEEETETVNSQQNSKHREKHYRIPPTRSLKSKHRGKGN